MADTTDIQGGVDFPQFLKSIMQSSPPTTSDTSTSFGGKAGANVDSIVGILGNMTTAVAGASVATKNAFAAQDGVDSILKDIATHASENSEVAGTAAGNVATAQGQDALLAEQRKQSAFDDAGLDPNDPSGFASKQIDNFQTAVSRYEAETNEAQRREGMSIGDIFKGTASVYDYLDAKLINPASQYKDRAKEELDLASAAATGLKQTADYYTGEAQIADSLHPNLTASIIADQATVAANKYAVQAQTYQIDSLIRQSDNYRQVIANQQFTASNAVAMARERIQGENAIRGWAVASTKTKSPEQLAYFAKLGMQALGITGADNLSAQLVSQLETNPAAKAKFNEYAMQGMMLAGSAQDPTAPLYNVYGSAGDTVLTLESSRGSRLPQGSEAIQKLLMEQAAGTEFDPLNPSKQFKGTERVNIINRKFGAWIVNHKDDYDSTDAYGKPPIKTIVASAKFKTPEMARAAEVLNPLAAANDTVPLAMVVDALNKSGMDNATTVQAIKNYMDMASGTIDARGKHQMFGLPTSAQVGYSGYVNKNSVFGGKVSLKNDEKAITDYVFKSRLDNSPKNDAPY